MLTAHRRTSRYPAQIALDSACWRAHLPDMVEAFVFIADARGDGSGVARTQLEDLERVYAAGAAEREVAPLVRLDLHDGSAPFKVGTSWTASEREATWSRGGVRSSTLFKVPGRL